MVDSLNLRGRYPPRYVPQLSKLQSSQQWTSVPAETLHVSVRVLLFMPPPDCPSYRTFLRSVCMVAGRYRYLAWLQLTLPSLAELSSPNVSSFKKGASMLEATTTRLDQIGLETFVFQHEILHSQLSVRLTINVQSSRLDPFPAQSTFQWLPSISSSLPSQSSIA